MSTIQFTSPGPDTYTAYSVRSMALLRIYAIPERNDGIASRKAPTTCSSAARVLPPYWAAQFFVRCALLARRPLAALSAESAQPTLTRLTREWSDERQHRDKAHAVFSPGRFRCGEGKRLRGYRLPVDYEEELRKAS